MLWAQMARASRAVVARERAWPPTFCYRIADSGLENYLSTVRPVEQWQDMSKGKQLREGLTSACSWYAIGDHKVLHSGWMVSKPEVIQIGVCRSVPGSRLVGSDLRACHRSLLRSTWGPTKNFCRCRTVTLVAIRVNQLSNQRCPVTSSKDI